MHNSSYDPIQWHEGMLLLPQHFQQADQRMQDLLHFHMASISPFHWGVKGYKVDPVLLINGILRFNELEAVLPDGLVFSHAKSDEGSLEVSLSDLKEELEKRKKLLNVK